ncbi:hypothetical protein ACFWIW_24580 [Amycolatopsis sp. NPDC058340]|uniref:hypothetical protein n=1 Tax=Amycolatopsis sp. NPDC058340 TaxID=3346453 RepID=UPI00365B76E1
MRASGLLGRPVTDSTGRSLGAVREIRAQPRMRGDGILEVAVVGLIVGPSSMRLFGFQRHDQRGPAPLVALIRWLHRHTRYVAWDDLELTETAVRVRKTYDELNPLVH